jgi:hypothetical protein
MLLAPKRAEATAPPLRFLPLQRLPARGSGIMDGLASPGRLRLQAFATSWRLLPPRACRPCFMPDPLLGFALQSFPPLEQPDTCFQGLSPHAVGIANRARKPPAPDSRWCLGSAPARSHWLEPGPLSDPPTSGSCSARESATPDRLFKPTRARSSPGPSPLQGALPRSDGSQSLPSCG